MLVDALCDFRVGVFRRRQAERFQCAEFVCPGKHDNDHRWSVGRPYNLKRRLGRYETFSRTDLRGDTFKPQFRIVIVIALNQNSSEICEPGTHNKIREHIVVTLNCAILGIRLSWTKDVKRGQLSDLDQMPKERPISFSLAKNGPGMPKLNS
jgi:hypothetical protein